MPQRKPRRRKPPQPPQTPPPAAERQAGADRYSADLVITLGVPETGKSSDTKQRVRPDTRLVVWDPNDEHQYHGCAVVRPFLHPDPKLRDDPLQRTRLLYDAMRRAGAHAARLAYVSDDMGDFGAVCRLARAWAQRAPCTYLVEELGDVVPPGKAPRWWGLCLHGGRHRGMKIRAVGHSPKEIDKTTLRMATLWRVHTLGTVADAEYLAREIINCDPAPLLSLPQYHYVEYERRDLTRTPKPGVTTKL